MPFTGREVERTGPYMCLKIDGTARSNELSSDVLMPFVGRKVERCAPSRPLVVDEGLRAWCRQQRADLRCVAMLRGFQKLPPRHNFPAPVFFIAKNSVDLVLRQPEELELLQILMA
jgi:hypothetical protein